MSLRKNLTVLAVCASLVQGCIFHDSRIREQTPARPQPETLCGTFVNKPVYVSRMFDSSATSDFGEVVGYRGIFEGRRVRADVFTLEERKGAGLAVRLEESGRIIFERTFRAEEGLKRDEEGRIHLPAAKGFGNPDLPESGTAKHHYALYLNHKDQVVVVQSAGGIGFKGAAPFGMHTKLMTVFPKK